QGRRDDDLQAARRQGGAGRDREVRRHDAVHHGRRGGAARGAGEVGLRADAHRHEGRRTEKRRAQKRREEEIARTTTLTETAPLGGAVFFGDLFFWGDGRGQT